MIIMVGEPEKTTFTPAVIIAVVSMIVASTSSTLSFKMQSTNYDYNHGMFQTLQMFIGEYFNLLIFAVRIGYSSTSVHKHFLSLSEEAAMNDQKIKFSKLWLAIPCFLDLLGSTCSLISLQLMPASM